MARIAIDFDGTLAAEGEGIAPGTGEPLPGAIEFLNTLLANGFEISIFSLTASYAPERIRQWLFRYLLERSVGIEVTDKKPHAFAYLDNRAIRFEGSYPSMEYLQGIK
jgi:hypothetical protein